MVSPKPGQDCLALIISTDHHLSRPVSSTSPRPSPTSMPLPQHTRQICPHRRRQAGQGPSRSQELGRDIASAPTAARPVELQHPTRGRLRRHHHQGRRGGRTGRDRGRQSGRSHCQSAGKAERVRYRAQTRRRPRSDPTSGDKAEGFALRCREVRPMYLFGTGFACR